MQELVREAWVGVSNGKTDVITASVMTNFAIMLARQAEESFQTSFTTVANSQNLVIALYGLFCEGKGTFSRPSNVHDARIFDLMYVEVAHAFQVWAKAETGGTPHLMDRAFVAVSDKAYSCHAQSACCDLESYNSEKEPLDPRWFCFGGLDQLLKEMNRGSIPMTPAFMADELWNGNDIFRENGRIPIWLIVAIQLALEAHASLGLDGISLQSTNLSLELATFRTHILDLQRHIFEETNCLSPPKGIKKCLEDALYWANVTIRTFDGGRRIWDKQPVTCGEVSLWVLHQYGEFSMLPYEDTVRNTLHLYNFLRQTGSLDIRWLDIEYLFHLITPEKMFPYGIPTTGKTCASTFYRVLGITSMDNRIGRRTNPAKREQVSKEALRILETRHLRSNIWKFDDIERLLDSLEPSKKSNNQHSYGQRSKGIDGEEILNKLKYGVEPIVKRWRVDEVTLGFRCYRFATELGEKLKHHEEIVRFANRDRTIDTFLGEIYKHITEALLRLSEERLSSSLELLRQSGVIMKEMIEREGDEEIKKLGLSEVDIPDMFPSVVES